MTEPEPSVSVQRAGDWVSSLSVPAGQPGAGRTPAKELLVIDREQGALAQYGSAPLRGMF